MNADAARHRLRATDITWREVNGELVVLDLRSSDYLSVNGTGAELWTLLVEGATVSELVTALIKTHEIDAPSAERDVRDFLAVLQQAQLLE